MTLAAPLLEGRAASYSPLNFLREHESTLGEHVEARLREGIEAGDVDVSGDVARWYWRRLGWDTEYFGWPVIRLDHAAWDPGLADPAGALAKSVDVLASAVSERDGRRPYIFAEMPAEETQAIGALGLAGFRLIETRVTYFAADLFAIALPSPEPVRLAGRADISLLRAVAAAARNPFDRYHADPTFGDSTADAYLATYAEASLRGLADVALVPDPDDGEPAGAFATGAMTSTPACPLGVDHACPLALDVGRIPLVAVAPERRGWHVRLLAEMTRLFAGRGIDVAHMTTQIPNRAVIRNCEKVGYRFGRATHILAARR